MTQPGRRKSAMAVICPVCHAEAGASCARSNGAERLSQHAARHELATTGVQRDHDRIADLRRMPYRSYLKTPEWRETRTAALKRAGNACQVCNQRGRLEVHHRTYARRGMERAEDVIALCHGCHDLFHGHRSLVK